MAKMTLRRAWFVAACFAVATPAAAQFPPQPQQPAAQFPPVGQQQQPASPWPAPGTQQPSGAFAPSAFGQPQAQQGPPPCVQEFMRLRDDTEKKGNAIRAASERHVNAKVACGLFNSFTAAEGKLLKYASEGVTTCGIPKQVVEQIKTGHGKALEMRTKVCQAAQAQAQGAAPARQPTLSDALGAPVTDSSNIKTGRGTFDTLTGTPLAPK
jgi:hypothetical protein